MCCSVLQHTATHRNNTATTLQQRCRSRCLKKSAASYFFLFLGCMLVQHAATHCNTLQHSAIHCNTLQHTATHCNTLPTTVPWKHLGAVLQQYCCSVVAILFTLCFALHRAEMSDVRVCGMHSFLKCFLSCVYMIRFLFYSFLHRGAVSDARVGDIFSGISYCKRVSSSVLQCVVVCCSVLQCIAVCCSVLQSAATLASVISC